MFEYVGMVWSNMLNNIDMLKHTISIQTLYIYTYIMLINLVWYDSNIDKLYHTETVLYDSNIDKLYHTEMVFASSPLSKYFISH